MQFANADVTVIETNAFFCQKANQLEWCEICPFFACMSLDKINFSAEAKMLIDIINQKSAQYVICGGLRRR